MSSSSAFSSWSAAFLVVALLAFACVCYWLFQRARQSESLLGTLRRENNTLRNEVASITGWTAEGRLPENWQEKLRTERMPQPGVALDAEDDGDAAIIVAREALRLIDPPGFATNDSAEDVSRSHQRTIDVIDSFSKLSKDPLPSLANGEFDKLFCYWRRLETYFFESIEADAYAIAAHTVLARLKQLDVKLIVPRPLSVASANSCRFSTDDNENLREISRIRTAALAAAKRQAILQAGEELVIDCERPGWNTPDNHVSPRILILDRSW